MPNNTGSTLQGLGQLLAGLAALNDPNRDARRKLQQNLIDDPDLKDKYIQNFQNDPTSLNTLLGRAPLINKGGYNQTKDLIAKGTISDKGQADIAKAKSSKLLAEEQGKISSSHLALMEKKAKGVPLTDEEEEDYDAFTGSASRLGIKDKQTSIAQGEAAIESSKASTAASKFNLGEAQKNALDAQDERETKKKNDLLITAAKAAKKKGENFYTLDKRGGLSPDQQQAIHTDPASKNEYEQGRLDFHQREADRQSNQNMANSKLMGIASFYVEHSGGQIGMDDAMKIAQNPRPFLESNDPKTQYIRDAIGIVDTNTRKTLKQPDKVLPAQKATESALKEYQADLVKTDDPQEALDILNSKVGIAWAQVAPGLDVPKFLLQDVPDGKTWYGSAKARPQLQLTHGDKDVDVYFKNVAPFVEEKTKREPSTPKDSTYDQRAAFEALGKKYPKESDEQIAARVKKGEKYK